MNSNTYIPDAFIDDVKSYIPEHLTIEDFIKSCQTPLKRAVRVNTLKMSVDAFESECAKRDWIITPVPWCDTGYWLERPAAEEDALPLGRTDLHLSGCIYVQEASSMLPPMALKDTLKDAHTVLDMAAAPGSKTSQLVAMLDNEGFLVANEYSSSRLKALSATLKRVGAHNVGLTHFDGAVFGDYMPEMFDAILLDAPCSGEGTVRKDADALKNWSLQSNVDISDVQKALIKSAFHALKVGGTLVYSTCTLTPIENQAVCQYLLEQYKGLIEVQSLHDLFPDADKAATEDGFLHIWPQIYDSEGFFIARFKKTGSQAVSEPKNKKGAFPFSPMPTKQSATFIQQLKKQFAINALPGEIYIRDKEVWLFPNVDNERLLHSVKYSRIGIQIGSTHKNGVRLEHEFASCLGHLAKQNVFDLSSEHAADYFNGKDIRLQTPTTHTGEVILRLRGASVGLGKWQKNKIKNSLARDLILDGMLITW
ncbi:16S rRNA (cytosine(1407)-C(5))-methyltransferase RsmF [Pseudoalteromonas sp. SSDWG2]|uniref:16S rRNA (cytosine(1407)-C(5))-methyltransferase RsmF n=1 Tax=Pseudoalteromonas sp. SSDWG2 TaxID=3139391 RepID=UPI003BA9DBD6